MSGRYVTESGTIFCWHDSHKDCPHKSGHACPMCDFGGYYRSRIRQEVGGSFCRCSNAHPSDDPEGCYCPEGHDECPVCNEEQEVGGNE